MKNIFKVLLGLIAFSFITLMTLTTIKYMMVIGDQVNGKTKTEITK